MDKKHPAFQITWWVNIYPDGSTSSDLSKTKDEALNRCTWTNDKPDAVQCEVALVPITN